MMTTWTVALRGSINYVDHPNHHTKGSIHHNDHPNNCTTGSQFIMMTTPNYHTKGASGYQLENWQLATRFHCCLHYDIIMSSNQTVYHKKYNMYNTYLYNIMNGKTQLNTFSCANNNITIGIAHLKVFSCAIKRWKVPPCGRGSYHKVALPYFIYFNLIYMVQLNKD